MLFDCRNPEVDTERGAGKESSSNYVMLQVYTCVCISSGVD